MPKRYVIRPDWDGLANGVQVYNYDTEDTYKVDTYTFCCDDCFRNLSRRNLMHAKLGFYSIRPGNFVNVWTKDLYLICIEVKDSYPVFIKLPGVRHG